MYRKYIVLLALVFGLALLVTGCQASGDSSVLPAVSETAAVTAEPVVAPTPTMTLSAENETDSAVPQPSGPTAEMDPVEVTQAFYDWYLDYIGSRCCGEFRNPIVDKVYQGNPFLTGRFVQQVEETVAGFVGAAYDPILLAQDVPSALMAEAPTVVGSHVRVAVERYWRGSRSDAIFAYLVQQDDVWLIDDVSTTTLYEPTTETPEGVVQRFYQWHIDLVERRFEDDTVDTSYHNSELLTAAFKQRLDDMIAEAEAENPEMGLHYDPLLCAQDVSAFVAPDQAFIVEDTALVTARTSFPNQVLLLDLRQAPDGWMIDNITCVWSPESTARAFYTWYLGYIGDRSTGNFRNPMVDRAYRWHPLLSPAFAQKIDELLAEMRQSPGGYDPFLLAQDVPSAFSVTPGETEGTAVVREEFGPGSTQHVLVTFVEEGGRWLINGIGEATVPESAGPAGPMLVAEVDIANWQPFADQEYGFAFMLPPDWVTQDSVMSGPGMPDDWPMVRNVQLMPPDIAAQLIQAGPPDPTAPTIVPPFNVSVVMGDQAAFDRVYPPAMELETADFNGYPVTVRWNDPGYVQYVFQAPDNPELWVIFEDMVTEFPGRETQAEAVTGLLMPMLHTFSFSQ
jgi:hypothetical protein